MEEHILSLNFFFTLDFFKTLLILAIDQSFCIRSQFALIWEALFAGELFLHAEEYLIKHQ
jgi:hypothetical protein